MKPGPESPPPWYRSATSDPSATSHKRVNSATAPQEDQDAKKKKKPIITAEMIQCVSDHLPDHIAAQISGEELSREYLTRDDLKLSEEERMNLSAKRFYQEMEKTGGYSKDIEYDKPEFVPNDPLPEGSAWTSYNTGSDAKDLVVHMFCINCGEGLDHWTADCPIKDSRLNYEFKKFLMMDESMPSSYLSYDLPPSGYLEPGYYLM